MHTDTWTKWMTFYRQQFQRNFSIYMENSRIANLILLRYISEGPDDNKSALVQVMAWRQTGDKPIWRQAIAWTNDGWDPWNHMASDIH